MTRAIALSPEHISRNILVLRGYRVLLDAQLAALYGVTTKRLNEQVKRNAERFPDDFMFRLTRSEVEVLNRSQIATGYQKHRDTRFPPFAFTEHGAIQAANVLNSPKAIEMGIYVVRAFLRLRECLPLTQSWPVSSGSWRPVSTRSSPTMTRPSPSFSRRFASS